MNTDPLKSTVRFAVPEGNTIEEMRHWLEENLAGKSLSDTGDCLLVWANEGDLYNGMFRSPDMTKKWEVGEFDEYGGYDCMTAGIRVGPALLDGFEYGQEALAPITDEQKSRMIADAHAIAYLMSR